MEIFGVFGAKTSLSAPPCGSSLRITVANRGTVDGAGPAACPLQAEAISMTATSIPADRLYIGIPPFAHVPVAGCPCTLIWHTDLNGTLTGSSPLLSRFC